MRVLGIDPGTAITGYAIVEEKGADAHLIAIGVIKTPAKAPLPQRLQKIYQDLQAIIAEHQPAAAAVEELFFSRNTRTAMAVGHARGVTLLALANASAVVDAPAESGGLDIAEYTPMEVKQAVTGYGNADKRQVQEMVRRLLHLSEIPKPDDAADAAAVALCYLHRYRMDRLLTESE